MDGCGLSNKHLQKGSGLARIHTRIDSRLSDHSSLQTVLASLWTLVNYVPLEWKSACLCYTKDKRYDLSNYIPACFLNFYFVYKTIEHILVSQIMNHLHGNSLCFNQFGFRTKHSCESQLLLTIYDFSMNNRTQVDIGILDFSKSFDRVAHLRLKLCKSWNSMK